ncbi:transglutaminase-like domain-containing protein, partial [Acinetobacter baumannii]
DYSLQDYLTLPPGYNPQTLAMAMQWQNEYANTSNPDKKLVQRALDWFHNDNFRYTMTPSPMGKQAIDDFLFSKKAGLCEHYAGAFVVLMRAL